MICYSFLFPQYLSPKSNSVHFCSTESSLKEEEEVQDAAIGVADAEAAILPWNKIANHVDAINMALTKNYLHSLTDVTSIIVSTLAGAATDAPSQ